METIKIGILKETKTPPDKRVPLSPKQCSEILKKYPNVEITIQKSNIRKYKDSEYEKLGLTLADDVSHCEILLGVKEVTIESLIPNKTYFFFSHTYKLQPYNAKLLKAIVDKKIRLVDWEMIKAPTGNRLIGFGRYAGIVGCYNGFRAFGIKHKLYDLKPAHMCEDRTEMEGELSKVDLPSNSRFVLTGFGRVGHGAREIINLLPIKEVGSDEFLEDKNDTPIFTHLKLSEYNTRVSDNKFDRQEFFNDPTGYKSTFPRYMAKSDMYIACHYWAEESPFLFTREDIKSKDWHTSVVADISCDIDGPVASTLRPSTISNPLYGYNRFTEKECDLLENDAICVMAVDNLPCELPKDASEDFGSEFIKSVLPHLVNGDREKIIEVASETTLEGKLSPHFSYLQEYIDKA